LPARDVERAFALNKADITKSGRDVEHSFGVLIVYRLMGETSGTVKNQPRFTNHNYPLQKQMYSGIFSVKFNL
jgi:hypothetical protein